MADADDAGYTEGRRRAYLNMLHVCLTGLGVHDPVTAQHAWILERQETLATLRRICAEYGDNDWPDDLAMSDILDTHLLRHLQRRDDERRA